MFAGGAVAVGPQQFAARAEQNSRAKGRIADKLIDLVGVGGAIGVDASSTLQRLAARLAPVRNLTVLTNGLDTFRSLQGHPGVTALLTGGELDESTGSLVGPLATRAAGDVMLRRLFVSASALDPELGSSESTLLDAEAKLALAGAAAEIVLGGRRVEARPPRAGALLRLRPDRHPRHRVGPNGQPSRPVPRPSRTWSERLPPVGDQASSAVHGLASTGVSQLGIGACSGSSIQQN